MMLAQFIGSVDASSAAVLIAIAVAITIISGFVLARKRPIELEHDFEIAKIQQADKTSIEIAQIRRRWDNEDLKSKTLIGTTNAGQD